MNSQTVAPVARILTPCTIPGCGELTAGGPCAAHREARQREHDRRRGTTAERGYGRDHRRLRLLCYQRDAWRCIDCGWEPNVDRLYREAGLGVPLAQAVLAEPRRASVWFGDLGGLDSRAGYLRHLQRADWTKGAKVKIGLAKQSITSCSVFPPGGRRGGRGRGARGATANLRGGRRVYGARDARREQSSLGSPRDRISWLTNRSRRWLSQCRRQGHRN
jgi:hypothetical protein